MTRKGTVPIGTIGGTPVRLRISVPVLLLLFALGGIATGNPMGHLLVSLLAGGSLLVHECAHWVVMKRLGYRLPVIVLDPLQPGPALPEERQPYDECRIAIAGPLVSGVLALIAWGILLVTRQPILVNTAPHAMGILPFLLVTNAALCLFNLLPALPLDGGRILRSLLSARHGRLTATILAARYSLITALGLLGCAVYFSNVLFAVGSMVVLLGATREAQQAQFQACLLGKTVRDAMVPVLRCLRPGDTVAVAEKRFSTTQESHLPVVLGSEVVGILSRQRLKRAYLEHDASAYISQFMNRKVTTLPAHQPLTQVMPLVMKTPVAVMDEDGCIGILTPDYLMEYVSATPIRP